MDIHEWLNQTHLTEEALKRHRETFATAKPFRHLEIKDFLKEEQAKKILNSLMDERFHLRESDLFRFYQTEDLASSKNPTIKAFRNFLSSPPFIHHLQKITGFRLRQGTIDTAGTIYEDTHFLLCHDDRLEGRKLAYFLYLSTLDKEDGGSLDLYASKKQTPTEPTASILPKFNTFAFFEVSEQSFHQIAEVTKDKQRIAISGWFHEAR